MPIQEDLIDNVLVVWEVDGEQRTPIAFYNQGLEEAAVKAWRREDSLDILTVWLTLPMHRFWIVQEHIDPLPFGKYRVDVKHAQILWWADSVTGSRLSGQNGSTRTRHRKVLRTARVVIG